MNKLQFPFWLLSRVEDVRFPLPAVAILGSGWVVLTRATPQNVQVRMRGLVQKGVSVATKETPLNPPLDLNTCPLSILHRAMIID